MNIITNQSKINMYRHYNEDEMIPVNEITDLSKHYKYTFQLQLCTFAVPMESYCSIQTGSCEYVSCIIGK